MEIINSNENITIKNIIKLKQKKYRDNQGLFLAEGRKFLDFEYKPEIIILREDIQEKKEILEKTLKFQCRKLLVSDKVFEKLSSQENSQGVILVYKQSYSTLENLNSNIVVIDKVQDPGNLGTILRVLDASGFSDVILIKGTVDCYNEKVIRSTMGSIFNLNISYVDEDRMVEILDNNSYNVIVTALDKNSVEYTKMRLKDKNAIIFGNEGNGVGEKLLKRADEKVIIPILGSAESLNVGVATGIIVYKMRELLG